MLQRILQMFKAAVKNVWFNKKQYVYFAILLVFVQSLLSCVILFNHNNTQNELRFLESEYAISVNGEEKNYHVVLSNLNENQRAEVMTAYASQQANARYFHPIMYERVTSGGTMRINMYLYFECADQPNRTPYELYERFLNSSLYQESLSLESDNPVAIQVTPLLEASHSELKNGAVTTLICVLITALGCVMFAILFNTVVNHFKFSYGVYMTFGANFRKLLTSALCEMTVVNLVTFLPSFGFSILITYLLTLRAGYGVSILIYPMFLALLCSMILTTVAVFAVMLKLSRQTPNNLIRSVNNVGLIASPRRSAILPDKGFPIRTELLSMVRFRKYVITLVLSTMIFAGAFCGGMFVVQAQNQKENIVRPQFELTFPSGGILHDTAAATTAQTPTTAETPISTDTPTTTEEPPYEYATGYTYTPKVRETLYAIDGVEYITKDRTVNALATKYHAHIMLPSDRLTLAAKNDGVTLKDGYHGYLNVDFKLLDEEVIDNLSQKGYTITGDLFSVLENHNTIAITDSYNNSLKSRLQVGDTVRIAVKCSYRKRLPSELSSDYKERLTSYINCFFFEYVEFTVGAILSDVPDGGCFAVYLCDEDFEEVTLTDAYFVNVQLYCDEDLSEEELRLVQTRLYTLAQEYKMTIVNTDQDTAAVTAKIKNYPGIFLYVSCLFLVVSILIMALSQALFYQMRKQELDIYLCLGADFKQIKKLFQVDAAFFAAICSVVYTVFALLLNYLFFRVANTNLSTAEIRFSFSVPIGSFFIGLGVTVLASVFCVMNAYRTFKKKSAPIFTGQSVEKALELADNKNQSDIFDADAR